MKKPKLTPWFHWSQKPTRKGVYNASVCRDPQFYRKWDGKTWFYGGYSVEEASEQTRRWPKRTPVRWRGLAADPSLAATKGKA